MGWAPMLEPQDSICKLKDIEKLFHVATSELVDLESKIPTAFEIVQPNLILRITEILKE